MSFDNAGCVLFLLRTACYRDDHCGPCEVCQNPESEYSQYVSLSGWVCVRGGGCACVELGVRAWSWVCVHGGGCARVEVGVRVWR